MSVWHSHQKYNFDGAASHSFLQNNKQFKIFLNVNVESNCNIDCFQKDIESVCDWAIDWSLSFNVKKCKILQLQ